MEEWKECKLEQVCENIYSGGTPATMVKEYWNGNLPWLSSGETGQRYIYSTEKTIAQLGFDNSSTRYAYKNSTVVASAGQGYTRGQASFLTIDTYVNQSVIVLKPNIKLIDPRYLYFNIDNRYAELRQLADGTSTRGSLSGKIMKDLSVKLPPLPTQQKIARILSSLNDKIELNNKITTNLEQQARALFKNWFVDFEPFGGKMPEGWKEKTLDSFCSIFTGRKNANASVENGKYKFFTCSPNVLPIDSFIFDGDAIIISGNGAYTGRTRFYSGKFDLYQRTYACTMKKDQNQDYIFILYWIIKFVLSKKIMGGTHGSAIPYIVMDDIAKFVINYDKKVFDDLSKIMKSYVLQIQDNENQNEKLAELRDTLLPKLMNGEIEV